jgi:hypothetical protein
MSLCDIYCELTEPNFSVVAYQDKDTALFTAT